MPKYSVCLHRVKLGRLDDRPAVIKFRHTPCKSQALQQVLSLCQRALHMKLLKTISAHHMEKFKSILYFMSPFFTLKNLMEIHYKNITSVDYVSLFIFVTFITKQVSSVCKHKHM